MTDVLKTMVLRSGARSNFLVFLRVGKSMLPHEKMLPVSSEQNMFLFPNMGLWLIPAITFIRKRKPVQYEVPKGCLFAMFSPHLLEESNPVPRQPKTVIEPLPNQFISNTSVLDVSFSCLSPDLSTEIRATRQQ